MSAVEERGDRQANQKHSQVASSSAPGRGKSWRCARYGGRWTPSGQYTRQRYGRKVHGQSHSPRWSWSWSSPGPCPSTSRASPRHRSSRSVLARPNAREGLRSACFCTSERTGSVGGAVPIVPAPSGFVPNEPRDPLMRCDSNIVRRLLRRGRGSC
ncbi:hypothetical protein CALVIDRAFT_93747 [Calocera viscosa TUFC12733]|uniref:Uncharacterized protein n=1 Tax=Calocera viscosa (strain TUFC12733) TaxID=1330018 RepID=A0A167MWF1_CALVF|nr:hypothetical protein CALVIDRAFT_93747 [Calocera viscosa TUFC12733]